MGALCQTLSKPNAVESEKTILGVCLYEDHAAEDVLRSVGPEMWYSGPHSEIARALALLVQSRSKIDTISVGEALKSINKLGEAGGFDYIFKLGESAAGSGTAKNLAFHISQVRRAYFARRMIDYAYKLTQDETDADALAAIQKYALARDAEGAQDYFRLDRDLPAYLDSLEKSEPEHAIIDSGYPGLDAILGGLKAGDLFTIGARPGHGKTAVASKIALQMAEAGNTVFYFSSEMTREQFIGRILTQRTEIPAWRFRKRLFELDHRTKLSEVCGGLHEKVKLIVSDTSRPSLQDLTTAAVRTKPRVVIMDYLQRMEKPRAENHTRQVDALMTGIKTICKDHKMIGILLCQLNRAIDRSSNEPTLADLRDSGSIEAESDQVMLLKMGEEQEFSHRIPITGAVLKNRHGRMGIVNFELEKEFVRVMEADHGQAAVDL